MSQRSTLFSDEIRKLLSGRPIDVKRIGDVEEFASRLAKAYLIPSQIASAATQTSMGATLIESLQAHMTAFQLGLGRRIATLLVDTINLTNERRLLASMLTLRGFIELVAALTYFEQRTTAALTKGVETQADLDSLLAHFRKAVQGSRFDWARWWLGGASQADLIAEYERLKKQADAPKPEIEQVNVMTMIESLDRAAAQADPEAKGRIFMLYGMLSDICHPALGGDLLFVDPNPRPGWIGHLPAVSDGVLKWAVGTITLPALRDAGQLARGSLNRLSHLGTTLQTQEVV